MAAGEIWRAQFGAGGVSALVGRGGSSEKRCKVVGLGQVFSPRNSPVCMHHCLCPPWHTQDGTGARVYSTCTHGTRVFYFRDS